MECSFLRKPLENGPELIRTHRTSTFSNYVLIIKRKFFDINLSISRDNFLSIDRSMNRLDCSFLGFIFWGKFRVCAFCPLRFPKFLPTSSLSFEEMLKRGNFWTTTEIYYFEFCFCAGTTFSQASLFIFISNACLFRAEILSPPLLPICSSINISIEFIAG